MTRLRPSAAARPVDWSHVLLDVEERAYIAGFPVFAGGATVHAAQAITAPTAHSSVSSARACSWPAAKRRGDAAGHARDRSRVRRRLLPPSPATPGPSAYATTATSSHLLNATGPNGRCGAPAARNTSPGWTPTSRTCTPRSNERSAKRMEHPRSRSALRSARTGLRATATWMPRTASTGRSACRGPTRTRRSRPRAPYDVLELWPLGRENEQDAVNAEAEAVARR